MCMPCFHRLQDLQELSPLEDGVVAHCKTCHVKIKAATKVYWTNDNQNGESRSSMTILLEWMTEKGNYLQYRGDTATPATLGKAKKDYAKEIVDSMNSAGVKVERTPKMLMDKIAHLENAFRKAHDWINNTGQGVDDQEQFRSAVIQRCEHYYMLEPILGERASAAPKHTTDSLLNSSSSSDKEEDNRGNNNDDNSVSYKSGGYKTNSSYKSAALKTSKRVGGKTTESSLKKQRRGVVDLNSYLEDSNQVRREMLEWKKEKHRADQQNAKRKSKQDELSNATLEKLCRAPTLLSSSI